VLHWLLSGILQVIVETPLPAELLSGQPLGEVRAQVINASGQPIHSAEVCLGWEDPADGLDRQSGALREMRLLNPLATGAYGPCLKNCTAASNMTDPVRLLHTCLATCREAAIASSNGFCNATDRLGCSRVG
jgi:hypothetical protein